MKGLVAIVALVILAGSNECVAAIKKNQAEPLKLPQRHRYEHSDRIDVSYDKFKDQTLISINWPSGMNVDNTALTIDFLFSFSGKLLAHAFRPSDKVTLLITSQSANWEYLYLRDLDLLVDGERIAIGTLNHDGRVGTGYVLESMSANISAAQFLRLANAKTIEGKLSTTEFSLSSDQILTIKDFASRLGGGSVEEAMEPIKPIAQ